MALSPADYMARALFHAARGRGRTTPNPMVGAVVVSPDGVVVGQGFHERAGEPHAEVHALASAGIRARGATLYCTLEPCSHTGRTPPCATRVVEAGITHVVAATGDPDPRVSGRGFAYLQEHGVTVSIGEGAATAALLNQPYFTRVRRQRPFVILKAAVSDDGYVASAPGRRTFLTSAAADRHAHRVRSEVDAIGVGVGTVLVDDPLLTARGPFRFRSLTRVVFDRTLRTPPSARLLSTGAAGPVIIVTGAAGANRADARAALEGCGAEIAVVEDGQLAPALRLLAARNINSLLLEGGAALHGAAWAEGVVDFVRLYITPHTLGSGVALLGGRRISPIDLRGARIEPLGPDVLMEGYVHGPC